LGRFSIEDKRKIIIKATDVVIFGPPVKYRQIIKDILLGCAILIASTCAWFADNQSKKSKRELSKLQTQIEMLSKTESDLKELQVQLKSDEQMKMELEQSRNEEAKERQSLTEEIKKVRTEADKLREMRMHSDENSESLCLAEEELQQGRYQDRVDDQ
jgi:septal ring factor EnvC (AmiA/AmiB activator)